MRVFSWALCVSLAAMAPRAQAVSTYTCTTFPIGMAMYSTPHVFPLSINNQEQVAGLWNVQLNFPPEPGTQAGFVVDNTGMPVPYALPAGGDVRQIAINNVGQVAGWLNLPYIVGGPYPTSLRSFISNPDGSVLMLSPPVDTPTQSFDNVQVSAINDNGDVLGAINVTDQNGIQSRYGFIRNVLGNYTLFDPSVGAGTFSPLPVSLNNAGTALFFGMIRYADGSEKPVASRAGFITWYGINNNGDIVGTAMEYSIPFPVVLTPDGNTPAVACPDINTGLKAYSINDNGVVAGALSVPSVPLQGTVFLATPTGFHSGVTLSNTNWGFSPNPVGQQGGSGIIYLTSNGVADLHIERIEIVPGSAGVIPDFVLTDTTCVSAQGSAQTPGTFAPGQFCSISFNFTPAAVGARIGQLVIFDDAPDAPHVIPLDGTGLGKRNLVLSDNSWTFGAGLVGETGGDGVIYIYNPGTDAINFSSIAVTGLNTSDFVISTNTCGKVLAPYTTCAVTFQFTPMSQGLRSAALTLIDDLPVSLQLIPIRGYGL